MKRFIIRDNKRIDSSTGDLCSYVEAEKEIAILTARIAELEKPVEPVKRKRTTKKK